jgi:hypothetical protein
MKPYKTLPPADENKPPLHDNTFKPPPTNYPQTNASFDKSPPYNDERPLNVIYKFPSFKGPHKQHMSSNITITDSYAMPLSEDKPQHNSSSEDGLSDDDGYPVYDTQNYDSHNYDTYDSRDHISHDDSHGPDHDHIHYHKPKEYYYHHHQSYGYEGHEIPAAHPPSKDHYHHRPEVMYGVHPPIYVYGMPTTTNSASNMTEAPETSTTPMEKKPPIRYYYLGRKLWLVPVYGTGILLVQMLYLLLKAIARHKVVTPFNLFTKLGSRDLESQRQQLLDSSTEHVTEALETAEYRYM